MGYNTNGEMGNQCQHFLKHLTKKMAQKDTEPYNTVIAWLRRQISFRLLRLHERLTNAFSQQDRTLLRLQNFHERLLPIL